MTRSVPEADTDPGLSAPPSVAARGLERALFAAAAVAAHGAWIGPGAARGDDPVAWGSVGAAGLAALLAGLRLRSRRSALATFPVVWAMAAAAGLGPRDALGVCSALLTSAVALALTAQWVAAGRAPPQTVAWTPVAGTARPQGWRWSGLLAAVLVLAGGAVPAAGLLDARYPSLTQGPLATGIAALGLGVGLWLADGVTSPAPPRRASLARRLVWMVLAAACVLGWWWLRGKAPLGGAR